MLIDHIGITVSDYARSKAFYSQALQPLGVSLLVEIEGWGGFGENGKAEFWFGEDKQAQTRMALT